MMMQKGGVKIWRPRQIYVGEGEREYESILERQTKEGKQELGSEPTKVSHIDYGSWRKRE